jgi:protein-arginine kinase activator protein McsA
VLAGIYDVAAGIEGGTYLVMDDFIEGMQGFSLPADAGITPLEFAQDHGLCTECEGRPASFEVQRPGEVTARRLCHECLFREFAPARSTKAEMIEQEVQRLAEAERTASPEELGRMTEFLELYWGGQTRPMPAFIKEFIARHASFASPLATPVIEGAVKTADMQAARIALLVMRGGIAEKYQIDDSHYVIAPMPNRLSREQAAEMLARMLKPLECRTRAVDGVMTLKCRTIKEPSYLSAREQSAEYWKKEGGHFPHLRRDHGDHYPELKIFCLGWRESLVVTAAEVERYDGDYAVNPMGTNASPPSFYLATNPEAARAANALGAAYIMKCHFGPNDWAAEEEGRVIDIRDTETWDTPEVFALTPDLDTTCESCGKRPATWLATDTRAKPWLDRELCDACAAAAVAPRTLEDAERFERWVTSLSEKGRRSVTNDIASSLERMERAWKLLPVPPEVAVAIARCR